MKLSPETSALVELLAKIARLPGGTVKPAGGRPRWERWLASVEENQLAPLIASRLLYEGAKRSRYPTWVEEVLVDRYARSGHEAAFRSTALMRLLDRFDAGSAPVVLKGGALAHTLYEEAAERPMSDLDLLVRSPEERDDARRRLAVAGFRSDRAFLLLRGRAAPPGHHHDDPLIDPVSELVLELHTNLATPPLPATAMADIWRRREKITTPGMEGLWVLDPVSALMHHALHAVADPIDSPLLRNLFEVAWLASRLDRADRSTLRSLAARWGVVDRLAVPLHLAARLFGTPPIVPAPRFDLRTVWCAARLDWVGSFEEQPMRARLLRHLARTHLEAITAGASPRSPFPLAAAFARSVVSALGSRVAELAERVRRASPRRISAVDMPAALVSGCALVHDERSGNVHVLDRAGTEVWSRTRAAKDAVALEEELGAAGLEPARVRAVIDRLFAAGLLRREIP